MRPACRQLGCVGLSTSQEGHGFRALFPENCFWGFHSTFLVLQKCGANRGTNSAVRAKRIHRGAMGHEQKSSLDKPFLLAWRSGKLSTWSVHMVSMQVALGSVSRMVK